MVVTVRGCDACSVAVQAEDACDATQQQLLQLQQ